MVYLRCDKRVRTLKGKLQEVGAVLRSKDLGLIPIESSQASLPGFFFENLESARHKGKSENKVPGILREKRREDA